MFDLEDDWVWDFWTAVDDSGATHLFFLKAPRTLGDPDLRHHSASVGHALSRDLVTWTRVADAIGPQPAPAYDDLATWTGSVARADDGTWWMFTSGLSKADDGLVQRIGASTSRDLLTWTRVPGLVVEADARWYSTDTEQPKVHWRDPMVVQGSDGWHLYATAQAPGGTGNGVVGHATSPDLRRWSVRAPLSAVTGRFDELEVLRLRRVAGRWVLLFSCLGPAMPRDGVGAGGIWSVPVDGPGAPVDIDAATRLTGEDLYVGDVVDGAAGPVLLAFRNRGPDGAFVGGVTGPMPVRWRADGRGLELVVPD